MAAGDNQVSAAVPMDAAAMSAAISAFTSWAATDLVVPIYQGNTVTFIKIKTA